MNDHVCPSCSGTGTVRTPTPAHDWDDPAYGEERDARCSRCSGSGRIDVPLKPLAEDYRVEFIAGLIREYPNPEEWVARWAHTVMNSSFDQVSYPEPAMDAWVARTHELMSSGHEVARCRRIYLTAAEHAEIEAQEADPDRW